MVALSKNGIFYDVARTSIQSAVTSSDPAIFSLICCSIQFNFETKGRPSNLEVQKALTRRFCWKTLKYAKCKYCKAFDTYAHTLILRSSMMRLAIPNMKVLLDVYLISLSSRSQSFKNLRCKTLRVGADQHFRKAVKYAKTNSCSIKTLCACALTA